MDNESPRHADQRRGPLHGLDDWYDGSLDDTCRTIVRTDGNTLSDLGLEEMHTRLGLERLKVGDVRAEIAEREREWRATRRPWFQEGLADIDAERKALNAFDRAMAQAESVITKRQKARKREEAELEIIRQREARLAERAEVARQRALAKDAFIGDPEFVRLRRDIIAIAHLLALAPAEEWGPETPLGLRMRGAIGLYDQRREQLREEHGQLPQEPPV